MHTNAATPVGREPAPTHSDASEGIARGGAAPRGRPGRSAPAPPLSRPRTRGRSRPTQVRSVRISARPHRPRPAAVRRAGPGNGEPASGGHWAWVASPSEGTRARLLARFGVGPERPPGEDGFIEVQTPTAQVAPDRLCVADGP